MAALASSTYTPIAAPSRLISATTVVQRNLQISAPVLGTTDPVSLSALSMRTTPRPHSENMDDESILPGEELSSNDVDAELNMEGSILLTILYVMVSQLEL